MTPPRPRNPRFADAFKRAGVVERTGRCVDTIFIDQLRNGRPAPSYQQSTETDIKLVLYGGKANLAFVRLVVEERNLGRLLQLDELLILNSLWIERTISVPAVSRLIQKSEADARAILGRLVEAGLIEARGKGKNRVFHLSSATYRRLNAKSEYVRQHGFDRSVDALGNPLRLRLTGSEVADITQAAALTAGYHPDFVLADKGYDADHFVEAIESQGAIPVISHRSNRKNQRFYDRHLYKERHLVECFVNKIKQYRRLFTRFDKLARNYFAFVNLAAVLIWLR